MRASLPRTLAVTVLTGCSGGANVLDAGPLPNKPCNDGAMCEGALVRVIATTGACSCCIQRFADRGQCDGKLDGCYDTMTATGKCDPNNLMFCSC